MLGPDKTMVGLPGDAFKGIYADTALRCISKKEADDQAIAAGWSVEVDVHGGNHRCPDCALSSEKQPEFSGYIRRGMYVERPD